MEKYRIIHITHSDLDAVGCDLVVRMFASSLGMNPDMAVKTYFCNVSGASKKTFEVLNDIKNGNLDHPSYIFITDITITDACAKALDEYASKNDVQLMHVDHHPTDKLNEKFKWSTVLSDEPLISATEIIFGIFANDFKIILNDSGFEKFKLICMDISRYDTWRWKKEPTNYHEENFNILCHFYGLSEYVSILQDVILNKRPLYNDTDDLIIRNFKNKREIELNRFIDNPTNIWFTEEDGMKIAYIMYTGDYINDILESVYLKYPEIDMVAGLMPVTRLITYRSNKPSVHCGKYAEKKYGGGGHKTAGGANFIDINTYTSIMNKFYRALENQKKEKRRNSFRTN